MRIVIYHDLPRGGAFYMLAEIASRLAARHEVDIYWLSGAQERDGYPEIRGVGRSMHHGFDLTPPSRCLPGSLLTPLDLHRLAGVNHVVARKVDQGAYDVVLAFASRHTQAPLVMRYLRTPVVYFCTEPLRVAYEPDTHPGRQPRLRHLAMNLVRAPFLGMLRRADHGLVQRPRGICTHSEFTRQQLKAIYGRDSHLCHYGIDPVKYQRIAARRTNTVLSVGAVHWRKGHEEAIRTVAAVDSDIRPAVIIAGQISDAREADYLLRLAGDAGVQVEIRIDSVNDQELVRLYSEARALLCLAYGEPFGLTPLECMACGTPVIAVDEGGFKETVVEGETGYLVGRDIAGSAERLTRLLRSPELSDQMGKRGVEHVRKNWTWEKGMAELEGAIGSAMCAERGSVGHPVQTPAETLPRPTICGE